jgi:hypothetical protein
LQSSLSRRQIRRIEQRFTHELVQLRVCIVLPPGIARPFAWLGCLAT